MTLTDARRFWLELKNAGTTGLHSWDCYGWTRNASQRAKDVTTKGQQVYAVVERRNGRPGARYFLEGFQPEHAEPVKPNRDVEAGGGTDEPIDSAASPAASLSITPAPADTHEPTALVRTGDGFTELPLDGPRTCRRCANTGFIGPDLPCPACDGEGLISRRRVNSYIDEREAA